jgi:hypothetical protein
MRRAVMLAPFACALLLALMAEVALAKGPNSGPGGGDAKTFNFKGTVDSINLEDPTSVGVDVDKGNGRAKVYEGQTLTFTVGTTTKIEVDEDKASLNELTVGDEVKV